MFPRHGDEFKMSVVSRQAESMLGDVDRAQNLPARRTEGDELVSDASQTC